MDLTQAFFLLQSLQQNIPNFSDVDQKWVGDFHSILDAVETWGNLGNLGNLGTGNLGETWGQTGRTPVISSQCGNLGKHPRRAGITVQTND